MNRNQRIVVSIAGIIIVTLALIGITYAYFLTKIIGNSTSKSISGTLANLELTYYDGNGIVEPDNLMMPGDTLEKTFSVKNTGTVKIENYAVVFENLTNTLTRKEDLVYTLTCSSDDNNPCIGVENVQFPDTNGPIIFNSINKGTTHSYTLTVTYKNLDDTDQSDDMGASFSAKVNITDGKNASLPIKTMILLNSNTSRNGTTYRTSPETTPAKETSAYLDQYVEKDFGEFSFMPNDHDVDYANSYTISGYEFQMESSQTGRYLSLLNNLKGKYIWYDWKETTNEIFEVIDATEDKLTLKRHRMVEKSKESTLSQISDVYGTSYYYRGDVTDNYLTFNNMCWKIVRIQGDGSTKIVLQDSYASCSEKTNEEYSLIGYGTWGNYNYSADYYQCKSDTDTCMKKKFDSWFNSKFTSVKDKLKEETWYLGDTTNTYKGDLYSYYEAAQRLNGYNQPRGVSLLSKTNEFTSYIGALTADEVALAGAKTDVYDGEKMDYNNQNYYLSVPGIHYWTISLGYRYGIDDTAFIVENNNGGSYNIVNDSYLSSTYKEVSDTYGLRPVIVLNSNVEVTGQGTKADPYIVK